MKTKHVSLPSRFTHAVNQITAGATALLLLLAVAPLQGATVTIYENDFESYADVAAGFDDESDADPTGIEWNIADDTGLNPATPGAGVQVINWLTNNAGQPNKALLLRSSSQAQINLRDVRSGSRYQLDFWVYSVKTPPADRGWYILLRGQGADINANDYLAYQSTRDTRNEIRYYDGVGPGAAAWVDTGIQHATNAWQHHRIVINPNALTFDVYLDDMDTPVLTGADLSRCETPVPTIIQIYHEGNSADDGYAIVDNISFAVDDAVDLSTTWTEGFEDYPARVNFDDDANPASPWIITEVDGTGTGRLRAPGKIQVVDSTVVTPRSGNKCLKLEGGQRAGASIAWGTPPQTDVQITWWARVPEAIQSSPTADAVFLRMSVYGAEGASTIAGDSALLGYGIRRQGPSGSITNLGDGTSLTCYVPGTLWVDTEVDYTPDVWEEYRLTTHTAQGLYTIIKNPNSANPDVVVDRMPLIGTATDWNPVFMAAWSSSNGTNHPPVYVDDIEIKSLVANADPLGQPYTPTIHGDRFTNFTQIVVGGPVGRPVVDPRDNTTILFNLDVEPPAGGIYRATKVASGNWVVDPTPVVNGQDRPSGLAITADGTLWWSHDYTMAVKRLKAPWESNVVEEVISFFGDPAIDDDPIDLTVAPASFAGSLGQPGMIVIADRGSDGDAFNAIYLLDPATTELNQTNSNFLVGPTTTGLGAGNLNAITPLPQSGEVMTVSQDGYLSAINADGVVRLIWPATLWADIYGPTPSGAAIAADPVSGRVWVAEDLLDEVWSVDVSEATQNTAPDQKELSFPLTDPDRPDRQIDFHDPGMSFAPDGSFLVVSDTSTGNGGGRLIIFHNEAIVLPTFSITSVERSTAGVQLAWESAGGAKYDVLRGTDLGNAASFVSIVTNLTATTFTDTEAPAGAAFYRVVAKP
jgi:hypothetical protein